MEAANEAIKLIAQAQQILNDFIDHEEIQHALKLMQDAIDKLISNCSA